MTYGNVELNAQSGGNTVAADTVGGDDFQRVKLAVGGEGVTIDVSAGDPMPVLQAPLDGRFKAYEDANFQTGDSPATHDFNNDAGRDGKRLIFKNDGAGDIKIEVSNDGAAFSDLFTTKTGETLELVDIEIDKVRLTWVTDSAYRLLVY